VTNLRIQKDTDGSDACAQQPLFKKNGTVYKTMTNSDRSAVDRPLSKLFTEGEVNNNVMMSFMQS